MEIEAQLINDLIFQERESINRHKEAVTQLQASDDKKSSKTKAKTSKLLSKINRANQNITRLQRRKQELIGSAKKKRLDLTVSEANFMTPKFTEGSLSKEQLQDRIQSIRLKIQKAAESLEFNTRYKNEFDDLKEQEEWLQNIDSLRKRIEFLKLRERFCIKSLAAMKHVSGSVSGTQQAMSTSTGDESGDKVKVREMKDDAASSSTPAREDATNDKPGDIPFPGIPLHFEETQSKEEGEDAEDANSFF